MFGLASGSKAEELRLAKDAVWEATASSLHGVNPLAGMGFVASL